MAGSAAATVRQESNQVIMSTLKQRTIARIIANHGCELLTAGDGRVVIKVQPARSQGWLIDNRAIVGVRAAVEATYPGATAEWLS